MVLHEFSFNIKLVKIYETITKKIHFLSHVGKPHLFFSSLVTWVEAIHEQPHKHACACNVAQLVIYSETI